MLEDTLHAAHRLSRQIRLRKGSIFYVAWGSSLRFVCFTKNDHAYLQYGEDLTRLVGCYKPGISPEDLEEDLISFLRERGFI